jgi:hypothetical protein
MFVVDGDCDMFRASSCSRRPATTWGASDHAGQRGLKPDRAVERVRQPTRVIAVPKELKPSSGVLRRLGKPRLRSNIRATVM